MTFKPSFKAKFRPIARVSRGGNPAVFEKKQERPLTGQVQGQIAAQGEERLARTIEKAIKKGIVLYHRFRWTTLKRGLPGYKELDELVVMPGRAVAISVKGVDFVHKSASDVEQDKLNELIILNQLKSYGFDIRKIETVRADQLTTQEDADKVGKDLGIYR